jgi:hypothetical protein
MSISSDGFRLEHGREIRESLIMIEGNDGAFELLACGWLAGSGGSTKPFAVVRSTGTNRVHLLVRSGGQDPRLVYNWHRIDAAILHNLVNRIAPARAGRITTQPASG